MSCCDCACISVDDLKRCLPDAIGLVGLGFSNQAEIDLVTAALFECVKDCPEEE